MAGAVDYLGTASRDGEAFAQDMECLRGLEILSKRDAWGTFLGLFCGNYAWYFLVFWLPSYLVMERHFSADMMAILGSVPILGRGAILYDWWMGVGPFDRTWRQPHARAQSVCGGRHAAQHVDSSGSVSTRSYGFHVTTDGSQPLIRPVHLEYLGRHANARRTRCGR